MAEQNISIFCNLNFVKSAVFFSDLQELSIRLKTVSDYYFNFITKLELLPDQVLKKEYIGHYDNLYIKGHEPTVAHIMQNVNQKKTYNNEVLPIHLRYTDPLKMHLVVGIARPEDRRNGYLHAIDLCLPKDLIRNVPANVLYVKDILDSYTTGQKQTVKDFVESKGYNYSHFQRDCKICFGDAFYSFRLKMNMMNAVGDIIFTDLSLKEIAFKNNFLDYANMYKAFVRHEVSLTCIPRLANL
ncbi:AraC family transcriptional regulator [Chryseobacterium rhizosphaerae]|uniref:AraC family transcriptional regulator n=1 Tax=Chryseobacterium rhizosphaerae TaxID=395937 RepID=UPI00286A0EE5|nr:helix-turn-helix domain-containing protein [Chryseobacterium rhizosphaerae]